MGVGENMNYKSPLSLFRGEGTPDCEKICDINVFCNDYVIK